MKLFRSLCWLALTVSILGSGRGFAQAPSAEALPANETTVPTAGDGPTERSSSAKPPQHPDPLEKPSLEAEQAEGEKKKLPPLTPDLANLNLAEDLELVTMDTQEKVLLPAGTYRQILRIPIDSPTMRSTETTRRERRPEVKIETAPPPDPGAPEKRPFWIRYESLEKIKINEEERRGGLDVPVNGPANVKIRLWYAKSETADAASSFFYFVFGGLGYSAANLAGWSAGNTREIPGDFEYRLIRR